MPPGDGTHEDGGRNDRMGSGGDYDWETLRQRALEQYRELTQLRGAGCLSRLVSLEKSYDGTSLEDWVQSALLRCLSELPKDAVDLPSADALLGEILKGVIRARNSTQRRLSRHLGLLERYALTLAPGDFEELLGLTNLDQVLCERLFDAFKGDVPARSLLAAVFHDRIEYGANKQLAAAINTSPQNVVNIKKRVFRKAVRILNEITA